MRFLLCDSTEGERKRKAFLRDGGSASRKIALEKFDMRVKSYNSDNMNQSAFQIGWSIRDSNP